MTVAAKAEFDDDVCVSGNSILVGNLTVGGTTTIGGAVSIAGALSVGGAAHFASTVTIAGNTTLTGTLGVGGAATFASTVTIAGNTTLTGNLGVGGTATIVGKAEFDDDVCVSGNSILVGNLTVGGTTTIGGATSIAGALSVGGATNLLSTLTVAGKAEFDDAVCVSGNTILVGNLTVGGTTTIGGAVSISGALSVGGAANFASTVTVAGATHLQSTVSVNGVMTLNNNLDMQDDDKILLGTHDDLQIYHDGSHSYISDVDTGSLIIKATDLYLQDADGDRFLFGDQGGAVELYHNASARLTTTANGATITGTLLATTDTDTTNSGDVRLDYSTNQNFVLTFTGNVVLTNPTTEQVGQSGIIVCIQDGTGSRTLSLGTDYETAGGAGITLSTAGNAVDVIPYFVKASGSIQLGAVQKAFS